MDKMKGIYVGAVVVAHGADAIVNGEGDLTDGKITMYTLSTQGELMRCVYQGGELVESELDKVLASLYASAPPDSYQDKPHDSDERKQFDAHVERCVRLLFEVCPIYAAILGDGDTLGVMVNSNFGLYIPDHVRSGMYDTPFMPPKKAYVQ
jgi:hypothetical protein